MKSKMVPRGLRAAKKATQAPSAVVVYTFSKDTQRFHDADGKMVSKAVVLGK